MKDSYQNYLKQTFDFPQKPFSVLKNQLNFHEIDLMKLIEKYGTPFKLVYLPSITEKIEKARQLFNKAIQKNNYSGKYYYAYCTKASHFQPVLKTVLQQKTAIEISSAFDVDLIQNLDFDKETAIICNGFKNKDYLNKIKYLLDEKYKPIIVLDNKSEIKELLKFNQKIEIGIRVAVSEENKSTRFGLPAKEVLDFYKNKIQGNRNLDLKMIHFYSGSEMNQQNNYWQNLENITSIYAELKKQCSSLEYLNIGGGFPIQKELDFEFDYEKTIEQIILKIQNVCSENRIKEPNIFTEFGTFTVGESAVIVFEVLDAKQQNLNDLWYIIDGSMMTNLPDLWTFYQKFILLGINNLANKKANVLLGGITCDSADIYPGGKVILPEFQAKERQFLGIFHTGAYQESIGGYGGLQHCLIPHPKKIIIEKNENGTLTDYLFAPEQNAQQVLEILGY